MSDLPPSHEPPAATHPSTDGSHSAGANAQPWRSPAMLALGAAVIVLLVLLLVLNRRHHNATTGTDSAELSALQAETRAMASELNRERVALGLRPLEGGSESMDDIAKRLKKDADTMVALANSYQVMIAEKDSVLTAKNAELLDSDRIRVSLANEGKRLQGELQRALVSGSEADLLRKDLAEMKAQRDAAAAELAGLRKERAAAPSAGASDDEYADLKRRYDETLKAKEFFEAKVQELSGDLKKAKLFANSENELLPAAVELFRSLRALENQPAAEINQAYGKLASTLGAEVLQTLHFATGSSSMAPADQEMVSQLTREMPEGDLVLAIGYASETGNVDQNRKLSSDRATAVAEAYAANKTAGQLVQAVYLGQTDRFSATEPERNQLVEIWRIRKK